jgi:hypothetical protein
LIKILYIIAVLFFFSGNPASAPLPVMPTDTPSTQFQATAEFSTFDVYEKVYGDQGSFMELDLQLPRILGDYDGIPEINQFFIDKEKFFYNQLPFEYMQLDEEAGKKVEGRYPDLFFRSAYYELGIKWGNIISVFAVLDGGAGGVGWLGIEGDTFDLNTGKKLSLSDIFKVNEAEYLEFIYGFVAEKITEYQLNGRNGGSIGYRDDDAYSGEGFKRIRKFDPDDYFLTENSLVVFYDKYALADGASGPQAFAIPYAAIRDILAIDINEPYPHSPSIIYTMYMRYRTFLERKAEDSIEFDVEFNLT